MHRSALTLIELLVAIAVMGLIASITVPAVFSARESSRLNSCLNNLRQQGLAMLQAEQSQKILPHGGGSTGARNSDGVLIGSEITSRDGRSVKLSITYAGLGSNGYFPLTLGDPKLSPQEQTGPWCYAILPFLDENVAYERVIFQRQQPIFLCPTRARVQMAVPVGDEFFSCESGGWAWAKTDYAQVYSIGYRMCGQPLAKFQRYGADKIVMIGEKAMDPFIQTKTSWFYDEPLFTSAMFNVQRSSGVGRPLFRDGEGADYKEGFGSAHRAGVNFTFFSARTQTIHYDIAPEVWEEINPPIPFDEVRIGPPDLN